MMKTHKIMNLHVPKKWDVFFPEKKAPAGRSWITKSLENTIESAISRNQTIPGHIPTHIPPFGAIYAAISMKKQPGLD